MIRAALVATLMFSSSCVLSPNGVAQGPLDMSTLALFVAVRVAVYAATGECLDACTNGTACNGKTHRCEPLPCGGRCNAFSEHCELATQTCLGNNAPDVTANWPDKLPTEPASTPPEVQ